MKIAVGVDGRTIAGHFGHSGYFQVFTIEDGRVIDQTLVENPGHTEDMNPPRFVAGLQVDAVIGGTIGQHALDTILEAGVTGIFGAAGDAAEAVDAYLAGTLQHDEKAVLLPGQPCC